MLRISLNSISCLFLLLFVGCVSLNVFYNKATIQERYVDKGYTVYLNGNAVDFEYLYLNKDNINTITRNKEEQSVHIVQAEAPEFLDFQDVKGDSIQLGENSLVVINGVPIDYKDVSKLKIEINAIKAIEILKQATNTTIFCRPSQDVILILVE